MPFIGVQPATVPLTSSDITDGIITGAKIETNPTISGNLTVSGLSNITLETDLWRLNTNLSMTSGVNAISANWERHDSYSHGVPLGTGMSESSGIFTFGQTGVYFIQLQGSFLVGGSNSLYTGMHIITTTDNSTYIGASVSYTNNNSGGTSSYYAVTTQHIFDVTDTSTHKVKISYENQVTNGTILGHTNVNQTTVIFTRLGNT